jgi:hypothetical protein
MGRIRFTLDFTIETEGDGLPFIGDPVDMIERAVRPFAVAILPGSRVGMRIDRRKRKEKKT